MLSIFIIDDILYAAASYGQAAILKCALQALDIPVVDSFFFGLLSSITLRKGEILVLWIHF